MPGGEAPEPLLQHFGIHARLLLALPLFLVAEASVQGALRRIVPQFVSSGVVGEAALPAFREILRDAARRHRSPLALAIVVGLTALSAWSAGGAPERNHELNWALETIAGAPSLDFGAFWFNWVSRPVFLLVLYAWLWRLGLLAFTFARIARLELRLAPTHPDRAGGLAFIEALPAGLAPLFFGLSVVIAGRWGHDAVYHGLDVRTLQIPAGVLVAASVGIGLAPLLVFVPRLHALRRASLAAYGALLGEYGRLFERRWIRRERVDDAPILEAPEIGPVADAVSLYEAVSHMRAVPIGRRSLVPIAVATVLPLLPVFATQMPIKEVIGVLLAPLIGI
jgi:hypothetical protein